MHPGLSTLVLVWLSVLLSLSETVKAGCVNWVNPCNTNASYFSSVPAFNYSSTVKSISKDNTSVRLTLALASNGTTMDYLLVRCGCPAPISENNNTAIIYVPVGSILLKDLPLSRFSKLLDSKPQTVDITYYNPSITDAVVSMPNGITYKYRNNVDFGNDTKPDLAIVAPDENLPAPTLLKFIDTTSLETDELGKAELIKLYGLLFGMESKAETVFYDTLHPKNRVSDTNVPSSFTASLKVIGIIVLALILMTLAYVRLSARSYTMRPPDSEHSNLPMAEMNSVPVVDTMDYHHHHHHVDNGVVDCDPPPYEDTGFGHHHHHHIDTGFVHHHVDTGFVHHH